MKEKKELNDVEELARELNGRFVSVHGEIRGLDEVIDEILNKRGDKATRRFVTG